MDIAPRAAATQSPEMTERIIDAGEWCDRLRYAAYDVVDIRHSRSTHWVDRRIVLEERHTDIDFHGPLLVFLDDPNEPIPDAVTFYFRCGPAYATEWEGELTAVHTDTKPTTDGRPAIAEFIVQAAE